jgi:peptidoglycan/LPS O-acetylase OafA/YrhL
MRQAELLLLTINATHRAIVGFLIECLVGIPVASASYLLFERPFIAARHACSRCATVVARWSVVTCAHGNQKGWA